MNRALSFAIAALVFLAISMEFPFLTIESSGITSSVTLLQTISSLVDYGASTVAILIFCITIVIPAISLGAIIVLAIMLQLKSFPDWMLPPTRWLYIFNAWAMVEVFSIAVIVSLVKIASMARVEIGLSFWAYLVFTALFLKAYSSLDRLSVWSAVDHLRGSV